MQQSRCKRERQEFKMVVIPTIQNLFPVVLVRIIIQYAAPMWWYQIDQRVNVDRLLTTVTSSQKRRMRRRRVYEYLGPT